ncbi:MAG: hypothetical protein O7H41_01390 [Planctomycetota bacterium]|nr:hypothetical protein [Planctomycetota bacterium]
MLSFLRNRQQQGLNPATRGTTHYEILPLTAFEPVTIPMNDGQVILTRSVGNPAGTTFGTNIGGLLLGNNLFVDPQSSGASENLLLPLEEHCVGLILWITNTGGEGIAVQNDSGGALGTIPSNGFGTALCDGTTWQLDLTDGQTLVANTQLTNAQMLLVAGTPVTLVPAPGANRGTIIHKVYLVCDSSGGAYTAGAADDLEVQYAGGVNISADIETSGFIDTGGVERRTYGVLDSEVIVTPNVAVEIFNNGGGEFGGGNAANTLSVRVWYSTVDTVPFS